MITASAASPQGVCQLLWISEVTNFAVLGSERQSIATQHFRALPGGDPGDSKKCEVLFATAALLLQFE